NPSEWNSDGGNFCSSAEPPSATELSEARQSEFPKRSNRRPPAIDEHQTRRAVQWDVVLTQVGQDRRVGGEVFEHGVVGRVYKRHRLPTEEAERLLLMQ